MEMDMVKAMALAMENQHVGEGSKSNWEGMLKDWIIDDGIRKRPAHSDGTTTTTTTHNHRPPKWRGVVQKLFMPTPPPEDYDIDDRVFDISSNISLGHDLLDPVVFEELLDELQAYAEDIDVFQVLDSDNCLSPIIRCLYNEHANVRAKAAEVITTMVQINPMNKKLVIQKSGLQLLLYNLTEDPDPTSRTKALAAISALLCNNKPAMTVFRLANGYSALRAPLSLRSGGCVSLQRDALNLIHDLLHQNSSDCNIVLELGFCRIMEYLNCSSDDGEVRTAAFRVFIVLSKFENSPSRRAWDADIENSLSRAWAAAAEAAVRCRVGFPCRT